MRGSYILKRFALMVATLYILITLVFFMFRLIPADPTALFIGASLDAASQKQLHEQFGLDKSLPKQYLIYMANLFQGEFGISIRTNRPVLGMLSGKIVNTLWMMGTSMSLALGLGIVFGTILAWKRGTGVDTGGIALFLALRSAPEFWLGMIFLVIFGFKLQWFPVGLMLTPGQTYTGFFDKFFSLDFFHHLFLPVFTMTVFYLATPMLVTRNAILDILHEDFIEMAHAKGLSSRRIMFRYALRNALLPVVTIAPLMLGFRHRRAGASGKSFLLAGHGPGADRGRLQHGLPGGASRLPIPGLDRYHRQFPGRHALHVPSTPGSRSAEWSGL